MTLKRYSELLFKYTKNPNIKDEFIKKFIPENFQRFLLPDKPLPLGRWNIPKVDKDKYNYEKIHNRANLANYDHCDPCGREFTPKNFEESKLKK